MPVFTPEVGVKRSTVSFNEIEVQPKIRASMEGYKSASHEPMSTVIELEATEELNQTLEKATEEEAEISNAKGTTSALEL